jgi:hypothetical protein
MNKREKTMLDILRQGKEEFGLLATKAEFEAEGTRIDELMRLTELSHKADLGLALKVGGCEAIRDMLDAKQLGVQYLIAPMVETPYALSKFIAAKNRVFTSEEQEDISFLFNLETITAFHNLEEMISMASEDTGCDGVVFGRVDFSRSLGLGRTGTEAEAVSTAVETVSRACLNRNLQFVVGGAITTNALTNLRRFQAIHLSRFETRKVVFEGAVLELPNLSKALLNALHFELLWLLNKREHYGIIHREDQARIAMLERFCQVLGSD